MTRMIFVRHGESTGNLLHRFYGHTDGELTEKGIEQAKITAEHLKSVHIDIAYASDLIRAFETGRIICEPHGITPIPDKELREIFAGEWENLVFHEILEKFPEGFGIWCNDLAACRPDGGESVAELADRIKAEVWRIAEKNDGKTVLVAIHATPIRALECEWRGLPLSAMNALTWVPNASVSIVNYDIETHTVTTEIIGDASFMGSLTTNIPNTL